eukprot:3562502-Amphidinium_carterae.1
MTRTLRQAAATCLTLDKQQNLCITSWQPVRSGRPLPVEHDIDASSTECLPLTIPSRIHQVHA